ncbi:hypothetical protein FOCC_FOCC015220 [Frankliniella occidentalis]|nr:hypothetical protein FOCC_FOCC015220 [Frankliniella occidentalis]
MEFVQILCPVCGERQVGFAGVRNHIQIVHGFNVTDARPGGFTCGACNNVPPYHTYRGWKDHTCRFHGPQPVNAEVDENNAQIDGNASSSDESAASIDVDDDLNDLFLLPNGRRDAHHAAVNMIVEMRSVAAMTRVGVSRAMCGADKILRVISSSLKADVTNYLERNGQIHDPRAQDLLNKFNVESPFKKIKSNKGQISGIKEYYSYIDPVTCYIDNRLDQRLGEDGAYGMVPVPNTYEYVSIVEILKLVVRKQSVMNYVRNLRPSADGMLGGYVDGDQFRNHPYFQEFPDAFQLVLYGDGVDPTRACGPKSGLHEIYNFFIIILNLPPWLRNSLDAIFPVIMANAHDCKGTFEAVLHRLVDELRQLEEGVREFVNDDFVTIRGCLVAVKGDAKAMHEILGYLACGARHFCCLCMISRAELHLGNIMLGEPRTREMTTEQLRRVGENVAYSTQCGLRYATCLHNLEHFRAENNKNFDLLHDGPEGVIIMLMRLCMMKMVCEQALFTVEELNDKIRTFNYGKQNIRDRPSPNFNLESLQNAARIHKQKMNAAQILVLFRALPLMLVNIGENGVDEENEYLQIYLLLLQIFQLVTAPRLPRNEIPHLARLLDIFRRSWYILFPGIDPINKFHHLMHAAENFLSMGPQRQFWCFREESKNCPGKRHIVACNNFKNPQKTAMEQAQIRVAQVWGTRSDDVVQHAKYVKRHNVLVRNSPASPQLRAFGFHADDVISVCTAVLKLGIEYRKGEFVLYNTRAELGLPSFGKIVSIICPEGTDFIWLAVEPWHNVGLVERFNAFAVTPKIPPVSHLIDLRDLPSHPPINQGVDGEGFLDLNEDKLIKNFQDNINYGQRKELLKIIKLFTPDKVDQGLLCPAPAKQISENEECSSHVLSGYVDDQGLFQLVTDSDDVESSFCVSASFLKKKQRHHQSESGKKSKKKRSEDDDVEATDILSILNKTEAGKQVIEFIRNNRCLDVKHQVRMMKIIYEHYASANDSPTKYYPHTNVKKSIAKGIVTDFPDLADEGEVTWMSWLKIVTTKFETIQSDLPPEKKKNAKKVLQMSGSTSAKTSKRTPETTPEKASTPVNLNLINETVSVDESETAKSHKTFMNDLVPTPSNKNIIGVALASSFTSRRKWILTVKPTCTDILNEYQHLSNYEGAMISQEFGRIEPLYQGDFIIKFNRLSPFIMQYARIIKPSLVKETEEKFSCDNLRAAVLLPKILVLTLNKITVPNAKFLDHVKKYKTVLEKIPSSALFQTAPEGTDVESYVSVEAADDSSEPTPIFPFVLWITNDYCSGKAYLKIDKKVIYLGGFSSQQET